MRINWFIRFAFWINRLNYETPTVAQITNTSITLDKEVRHYLLPSNVGENVLIIARKKNER